MSPAAVFIVVVVVTVVVADRPSTPPQKKNNIGVARPRCSECLKLFRTVQLNSAVFRILPNIANTTTKKAQCFVFCNRHGHRSTRESGAIEGDMTLSWDFWFQSKFWSAYDSGWHRKSQLFVTYTGFLCYIDKNAHLFGFLFELWTRS